MSSHNTCRSQDSLGYWLVKGVLAVNEVAVDIIEKACRSGLRQTAIGYLVELCAFGWDELLLKESHELGRGFAEAEDARKCKARERSLVDSGQDVLDIWDKATKCDACEVELRRVRRLQFSWIILALVSCWQETMPDLPAHSDANDPPE